MERVVTELTPSDVLRLRMISLLLSDPAWHGGPEVVGGGSEAGVAGVVGWFGAMQAQDLASVMWSLGVRLPALTRVDVEAALERREVLRTWPMRGTVHLVPARDAHWMLEVMGSRALAGAQARRAALGLSGQLADRGVEVLAAALAGGGRLTRAQCLEVLADAGLRGQGQFGYHLLWYASQRAVTCIAPHVGGQQTFVLLDEWVPHPHRPGREEALATIAVRYFRGHGPTTVRDFAGWTGLTMADSRRGIAAAGEALTTVGVEGAELVLDPALLDRQPAGPGGAVGADGVLALPGFDEYLLGFKDRSLMVAVEHLQAIIPGGNGVFQPTIVRSGRVIATWKRTQARGRTVVDVRRLTTVSGRDRAPVEGALQAYARFIGQPLEIRWP